MKFDRAAPDAYNFFHITPALDIVSFFVSTNEYLKGSSEILAFTLSPGLKQFEWNAGNLVRVLKYPKALADFFAAYDDLMVMFETLQSWCEDGFPAEPREIRR